MDVYIKTIQVIGVISSIGAGAFIMTDDNFGFILSKYLQVPNDPYYRWVSKIGGWEKKRQMWGTARSKATIITNVDNSPSY